MPVRLPLDVNVRLSNSVVSVPLHYLNFSNGALQAVSSLILLADLVGFRMRLCCIWRLGAQCLTVRVSCDTTPILLSQLIGEFILAAASSILVNFRLQVHRKEVQEGCGQPTQRIMDKLEIMKKGSLYNN